MVKYRYLIVRGDPPSCYLQILELYPLAGFISLTHLPRLVAIYGDILALGVPREAVRTVRAVVALLDNCRTIKIVGTSKKARAVAATSAWPL
ncbi:MAG: hypothetical protein ACK4M3_06530 [Pyrobaculum sp.]